MNILTLAHGHGMLLAMQSIHLLKNFSIIQIDTDREQYLFSYNKSYGNFEVEFENVSL